MTDTTIDHPPIFDHFAPELAGPAFWAAVRELQQRGPVVRVDSPYGPYWAATGYEAVVRIAQDWQTFTSSEGVSINRPSIEQMPKMMPIEIDPPRQRDYRKWINPHLTISAMSELDGAIRTITNEVIDDFAARGTCDIVTEFTRRLPGTVLFRLLFGATDDDFHDVEAAGKVVSFSADPYSVAEGAARLRSWAQGMIASRAGTPPVDDLVGAVVTLGDSGMTLEDHEYLSALVIFIQGGIGTAANATGTIVRVLAEDHELQRRVRAEPELIPTLVEECLRVEAPTVLLFRTATRDVDIDGCQMRAGDKVGLHFGAANRDPAIFDEPDAIRLDRPHYRHLAFGAGTHRCIGSNLARLQLRIYTEELLRRTSAFRIPVGATLGYAGGQTRGLASMPFEFDIASG